RVSRVRIIRCPNPTTHPPHPTRTSSSFILQPSTRISSSFSLQPSAFILHPSSFLLPPSLMSRHFLAISSLTRDDLREIIGMAQRLKAASKEALAANRREPAHLVGKTLAAIYEKPSLRTRCSFETGMFQLGGHAINLQASEIGKLGERESI